jgi:hypothetical protein
MNPFYVLTQAICKIISSCAWVYVICTVKLDEENPTFDGFAQENGFGSTKMYAFDVASKRRGNVCTCRNEYNKYDY